MKVLVDQHHHHYMLLIWGQVAKAAVSGEKLRDFSLHLQLIWGDPKAFSDKPRDVVMPACPESSLGSHPGGTSLEQVDVQEAPETDEIRATSTTFSRCGGVAALLQVPSR